MGRQAEISTKPFSSIHDEIQLRLSLIQWILIMIMRHCCVNMINIVVKRNKVHERAKFHQRVHEPSESVEAFVRRLYDLGAHCGFG